MKNKSLRIFIVLMLSVLLILLIFVFQNKQIFNCPFTSISLDNALSDMFEIEGDDFDSYDSVYNGLTYVYPKNYLNTDGTVKYMYDDKNELKCIAWTYSTSNTENLDNIYNTIESDLVYNYGESDYQPLSPTNYGDVWYLDGYNIILSAITTNSQTALQYSYTISPDE